MQGARAGHGLGWCRWPVQAAWLAGWPAGLGWCRWLVQVAGAGGWRRWLVQVVNYGYRFRLLLLCRAACASFPFSSWSLRSGSGAAVARGRSGRWSGGLGSPRGPGPPHVGRAAALPQPCPAAALSHLAPCRRASPKRRGVPRAIVGAGSAPASARPRAARPTRPLAVPPGRGWPRPRPRGSVGGEKDTPALQARARASSGTTPKHTRHALQFPARRTSSTAARRSSRGREGLSERLCHIRRLAGSWRCTASCWCSTKQSRHWQTMPRLMMARHGVLS